MHNIIKTAFFAALLLGFAACDRDDTPEEGAKVHFIIRTNPNQVRLNNLGQPATMPSNHAAQSPTYNKISAHYIELSPTMYTAIGAGEVVYHASETTLGGATAITFDSAIVIAPNTRMLSVPVKNIAAGSYSYLRASILYQNYDIAFTTQGINGTGTIASLVGFNTYLRNLQIKDQTIAVNSNKLQGFWAFETFGMTFQGQAPAGATTVPNPIFATSPIPAGSCLVTGEFARPFTITGNETEDITVVISLSTNNSFEWRDNGDGLFDPQVDTVVDMGLRGMIPSVE